MLLPAAFRTVRMQDKLDQILLELLELFFNLSGFWLLLTLSVVVHRLFCLMIKKKKMF